MPPNYPGQPPQQPVQPNYDFIVNPGQPPKKSLLPGSSSMLVRVAVIGVGLVILLILFVIVKGIIVKGPDYSGYITVAADQQELLHLVNSTTSNSTQQGLSSNDQNLVATARLSLASNQSQVLTYLSSNGQKVKTNMLASKLNGQLDTELTNSQTAGTYDQTFQGILQSQLNSYKKDLAHTYNANTGPNGRAMLKNLYAQASLLQSQVPAGD